MVAFVGLIGVWIYSMLPLLGSFKRTIGNLGMSKPPIAIINSQQDHNPAPILKAPAEPTPTLQAEITVPVIFPILTNGENDQAALGLQHSTYVLSPGQEEQTEQALVPATETGSDLDLPQLVYDLDVVLYQRSDKLRLKYADKPVVETYPGKYSYYWPPLGGSNCDQVNGVAECEYMASGYKVADYIGIGWACDAKIPLGYIIEIVELNIWGECTDRGYTIKQDKDGLYWFDQLIGYPMTTWEAPITVRTYAP